MLQLLIWIELPVFAQLLPDLLHDHMAVAQHHVKGGVRVIEAVQQNL